MPSKNGDHVTTKNLKLNAQWLKNAARTLGMSGISTISDISPNLTGAGRVAASSIGTVASAASNVRRQQRPIQYLLESNKYVKLGKRAIDNALSDLAHGKFTNQDRGSGGGEMGDTSTGTYFGEMSDGDGGGEAPAQIQNVYNIDTKAIDNVANAVTTQTKYQLQMGKANIDTMVAVTASSMTQSQKNADAILAQVSEMNRGIQSLVAYNNENMTKFITAAMAYYENAGKALGGKESSPTSSISRSVLNENGGLNVEAYSERVKKQVISTFQGATAGIALQMIADNADELVNNPLGIATQAMMSKAIPEVTKKAMKATDKVFGSFMTEMLLQMGDKWEADTSDGLIGIAKRFAAKAFGINDKRKTSVDRSGKITEETAVFDQVTRNAIIDELPKYARESTSYLRAITELLGGDPNAALRGSRILNRETGRYQSMESFASEFADSIDKQVIASMDKTSFGQELRSMANQKGKNDEQIKTLNDAIDKFFVAAERNSKGRINQFDINEGGEMSELIKSAGLDPKMQEFIQKTVANMVKYNAGIADFNEGRLRARRSRNTRIDEISGDTGMLRTTNLFRSGNSSDNIDVSSVTSESLLPQKRKGGINLPITKSQSVGSQMADALYGDGSARLIGSATPRNMTAGSIGESLKTIKDILLRGINVRIDPREPWKGAEGIGGIGGGGSGIIIPRQTSGKPEQAVSQAQVNSTAQTNSSNDDIDISDLDETAEVMMGGRNTPATGRGSKVANSLAHAKQAMYLMMSGNTSLAMNEMSTMLGETVSGVASAANKHILEPLKNAILPTTEVTDENGNKTQKRLTVLEMVRDKFSSVTNSVKETLLGTDEDGKPKKLTAVFQEGLNEWKKTIFGDKDPEEIKKEIQTRMPDAVGGAMAGSLVGMLVGGPFAGAIIGAGAGFAKKSKWFQDMIFGEQDEAGNEIKKGLIPPNVQKYYQENRKSLTAGAAIGGLMGMVVGGPVLGAAAGIGASILKKSDKFNELVFGKEEKDDATGEVKKVGGVLNLFKEVGGHYWAGTEDSAKGLSAKALVGAGGGLLMSLFTPIGPIGGAALGLAASVASNGDRIKHFLFGKENPDGTKEAGLFQKTGNDITAHVINPLRDGVIDFFEESKDKVIDKMLAPMLAALQPLLNFGGRIYEKTLGRIAEGASKAGEAFTGLLRTVGKKIWEKTAGRAGRFVKRVAKAGVSAVTSVAGGTVGKLGKWAEKRNRKASLKRFNKEEHPELIKQWTEEYNNNPDLQTKSLDDYLDDMKSRHYYNYGEKLKNYFGTDEERAKARQETADRVAKRKELRKQSLLIDQLTGGKFSDTGATAKQAALEAYMKTGRYARGKGINIKHYGKMSQEDIIKALTVEKSESSAISSAQAMMMDEQLEESRKAAGTLGKIYDWLESVGRKITGADNPERQEKREQKKAAKTAKSTAKQERKEAARKEAARRKEAYEEALNTTAASTASTYGARVDAKINTLADKWKSKEDEIQKALKSKNPTIKKAAKKAYPAFFDEDGERIIGSNIKEAIQINMAKNAAYKLFNETVHSSKALATQEGFLQSGLVGKTIGKIPGMGLVDQGLGRIGNLRRYITQKHLKQHAAGGIAENEETAIVGERGPEIIQFPNRARVLPNSKQINVNVVGMAPDVAKMVSSNTAIQDVRIVGQNGLLATYGTSAKLGSKTNNSGKVENQLEDPDKLVRYDDIKQDNGDYEAQEEKTPSLLEKLLGMFGGDGGILSKLGLIAGGAGLIALLGNSDFRNLLKDTFKWAFGEDGPVQTANREIEEAASGAHTVTDPTTGKGVSVVDAETHNTKKSNGAISSAIDTQFGSPAGLLATGKDVLIQHAGTKLVSKAGTALAGTSWLGGKAAGGLANVANFVPRTVQSIGTTIQAKAAGEVGSKGFMGTIKTFGAAMGSNSGSSALSSVAGGAGKFSGMALKAGNLFKTAAGAPAQITGALATIASDISWEAAETSRHTALSGDYGFGNAGGFRSESKTVKTVTTAGLGLAASLATAAAINLWHPGGWIIAISAGIVAICAALSAVINHLVGWIQDKSDREYSIRSNSAKLNSVINGGIVYDNTTMNPRYVYCAQESDRVLGLDEGVFVGEADVCMANFLYVVKQNITSSPGAEVLLYDLINNMAVQGVPFACNLAGSSNICSADGAQANSEFNKPIITEESGFLKGAKTQVTQSRVQKNIAAIMSDISTNVERNSGSDHMWSMEDLETVYNAGKEVCATLTKVGILKDNGKTVNTKVFEGAPNSGKKDSGWKSLDKLTREKGSYFLAKCIVYINSKVEAKDGQQWIERKRDYLEMLLHGLNDFLQKESGMSAEEMKEAGYSDDDIKEIMEEREQKENDSAGTLAQSTGGISADTEQVYESVNKSGIKAGDKADISKELRFLTAAWAYAHPAELQKWVQEHPDESGMPLNYRGLITSWNDKKTISDSNTRKELRKEMVKASLQYAVNHGDIFGWIPLVKWDDSYDVDDWGNGTYGVYSESGWNMDAQQYGPGYIFRGRNKEGEGKLQKLFMDPKLGYDKTPEDMHDILFGSKEENEGSEGNDPSDIDASTFWTGSDVGIIGGIANRIQHHASDTAEAMYTDRSEYFPENILANIPTNSPPNVNVQDDLVTQEKKSAFTSLFDGVFEVAGKLAESTKNATSGASGGKGGRGNIIPFYSQKDPRWAGRPYDPNNTETMADAGCGPAALSMAVNGAGGMGPTPVDTANRLQEIGARDNTGTSWNGMDRGITSYGLKADQASNPGENFVDAGLNSGKPVILSGTSFDRDDPFTSQGHYVVVSGKDRNGNYVVNDPNEQTPVTYTKEQVTRNAAKGWRVGGGRGRFPAVRGGGRATNAMISMMADGGGGTSNSLAASKEKWINIIKAVKQAIAQQQPGYDQSNWIKITVGGKELTVRTDCSGFVAACLKYMGTMGDDQNISTLNTNNPNDSIMMKTGFKPSSFAGWDVLEPGDIVSRSGHVEIFARNDGNTHYVWNCGSNDSVNNPNETRASNKGYDYVWRLGEACPGGITDFSVTSSGYTGSTAVSSGESGSNGGFLSKLMSWGSNLASKAIGWLTGDMSLEQATDWSDWKFGTSSSSGSSTATSTASSGADYSNTDVANLTGNNTTEKIWNHLTTKTGLDKYAAAGAMGCWQAESHNDPDTFEGYYLSGAKKMGGAPGVLASNASLNEYTKNVLFPAYNGKNINRDAYLGTDGNYYPGFGLAQWTGPRGQELMEFSKSKGVPWRSLEGQLGYFDYELKNNKRGTVDSYNGFNSLEDATWNFMRKYEGNQSQAYYDKRIPSARSFYEMYANNDGGSTGGSSGIAGGTSSNQTETTLGGSGGGKGGETATRYRGNVTYNTQTYSHRGGRGTDTFATPSGSASPTNTIDNHDIASMISSNTGSTSQKSQEETLANLLKQIVQILSSSDQKLNNLSYLSEINSLGRGTTVNTNVTSVDINQMGKQNTHKKDAGVEKVSRGGYEEARRIVAG